MSFCFENKIAPSPFTSYITKPIPLVWVESQVVHSQRLLLVILFLHTVSMEDHFISSFRHVTL